MLPRERFEPPPTELLLARLEARVLSLLSEMDLPPERLHIETTFAGRRLCVQLRPAGELPPPPPPEPRGPRTDCERDIFATLAEAGCPMTGALIRAKMETLDRLWGESTIGQALANMTSDGVLKNERKLGGYFIPTTNLPTKGE